MRDPLRSITGAVRSLAWPLIAISLLLLFNALFTPGFFVIEARGGRVFGVLIDILNHGSRVAIVALGMTLVIATGGVDLSVGAITAISGAIMAKLLTQAGVPWPAAIAAALVASLLCGLWNGMLVVSLRLQPIVATLILMVAGRGIAQLITDGLIITFEHPIVASIGNGAFVWLPFPVTILLAVAMAIGLLCRKTPTGLFIAAVGDNENASRFAGVPESKIKLIAYLVCGLLAGIAGVIECSYIKAADANNAGNLLELDAILAVVIGGTSLNGGKFSLVGTVLGALLMQTLTKTLYMQDVSAEIAPAPKAAAVILVCLLQSQSFRSFVTSLFRRGAAS